MRMPIFFEKSFRSSIVGAVRNLFIPDYRNRNRKKNCKKAECRKCIILKMFLNLHWTVSKYMKYVVE
jgi:hypothetical protein